MKTLKHLIVLFGLSAITLITMSFTTKDIQTTYDTALSEGPLRPDLKVSAIATPGGLCKGNKSKVRVSITNSQMVGVKVDIPVILFISQNGYSHSYVGKLKGGIGPNTNTGQPVWFNDVVIDNTSKVTLKAVVNPDHEIFESVPNNNTKVIYAKVKGDCGQTATAPTALLTVTVRKYSEESGLGQASAGALVTVKRNGQLNSYTGTTDSNGKVTFNNVPNGMCNVKVAKDGYHHCAPYGDGAPYPNGQSYNKPPYTAKLSISMAQN